MTMIKTVLLVEDNPGDARLLREMFVEQGPTDARLIHVERMSDAEKYLAEHPVDIVLLDLGLPDARGLEAVKRALAAAPHVAVVVLTGLDDGSLAARCLQEGAQDYLIKGQSDVYGGPRGLVRALRYAVERKALEEALFAEKERAQVTLDSIGDAVICTDVSGNITFLNGIAEKLTGWTRHAAAGQPMTEVFQVLDAGYGDINLRPSAMPAVQNPAEHLSSDRILVRGDGKVIPIEDRVAPTHDREGQATGTVIVFRDVSAARAMAKQMILSAQHDFLTGLPNRILLNDRIGQAIALTERHAGKVALLFLDLDGFKHINDSLGHPVGDKLLQSVAKRLVDCVRGSDTVSRQGGDEFVILLPELRCLEDALISVRRILKAMAEPHSIDQRDLYITTSIGVSIYPDDGPDAEALIKNADTAMYQAKENGRQGYQFFKPAMNVRAVERQSVEEDLRRALKCHEFKLQYQPKIDLETGAIAGAEALLRWIHPTKGVISPDKFIPVAEDSGLILPMGAWVLHEACTQAQNWLDQGLHLATVAVNVSAMEFRDDNFLQGLLEILDETGLDPRYLEIELTEGVLMRRADSAAAILQTLRDRGVKIAIDDFGTGYSSLSYLRKFPVDALKIDQSFVRQISDKGYDTAIVTAVIGMAHSLGLRVVAEGVETREELEFLRAHQCDEAQGFYFGQPVSPQQFAELIRTGIPELKNAPLTIVVPASKGAGTREFARTPQTVPETAPVAADGKQADTRAFKKVLLVEDNPGDVRLLREMFNEDDSRDVDLTCVTFMAEAERHLTVRTVDMILLDPGLPDAQGLTAIRRARIAAPGIPLVVLTGLDDETLAAQSLREGAQDYLIKGQIEPRGLLRSLRYAAERKRLERLKDEFVSTVSHELRTPLTSIAGSLGLLMGKPAGTLPEPVTRLLAIAHSNCQRLIRLVNDILDIEKLESGHAVFDLKRVEVRPLVEKTVESVRGFAEGHGVKIGIEAAPDVDDVRADIDRLAQAVTNLLSNAIKASPPDGEVMVAVANGARLVRISVRDHGPGIPDDFRTRMFERFAQADASSSRQMGGTGLGLSIVKQIVGRLDGEVGFVDAPGGGTIFHIELPVWNGMAGLTHDEQIRNTSSTSEISRAGAEEAATPDHITLAPAGITKEAV